MASLVKEKKEPAGPALTQGTEKDAEQAKETNESTPEESSGDMPVMMILFIVAAGGAYFLTRKKA